MKQENEKACTGFSTGSEAGGLPIEEYIRQAALRLRQPVAAGFLYTHSRLSANAAKSLEAASFLYALVELLIEKGLITIEELDRRKQTVGQRLAEEFKRKGMGVMLQDPEYDKYSFSQEVSLACPSRLRLCRGACCRIPFALSRQDIREGIVHWDLGQPYLIDQGDDGYCVHMDRETLGCTVYSHRPVPCRAFDCRKNGQIWLDFDRKLVNPDIHRTHWPQDPAENEHSEGCSSREDAGAKAGP